MNLEQAMQTAQACANRSAKPMGIWEHVGDFGHPAGDIPARGSFMVRALDLHDPPRGWALVGTADPEAEKK